MSSFLPIVFIVLAIALAVGPVMMLRPSKYQKKIARLRSIAAQSGLIVQSDGAEGDVLYYLPRTKQAKAPNSWRLTKQSFAHEAHFFGLWDWGESDSALSGDIEGDLKSFLESIHGSNTLGSNRIGVFMGWDEVLAGRTPEVAVAELKALLLQFTRLLDKQNNV